MDSFYESRELDRLKKSSNEKLNKAKEILKDNEKNINSNIEKIEKDYKSYRYRAESSMFDDIIFDGFTMLDEGKQADEYRARKAKEAKDDERKSLIRNVNYSNTKDKEANIKSKRDMEDYDKDMGYTKAARTSDQGRAAAKFATRIYRGKEEIDTNNKNHRDLMIKSAYAMDAYDRHLRRHPKTESALMLIAGYEPEYAY